MCGKIIHLALLTALLILFCSCNDSQNPEAPNFPGCSDGEVEYNSADSTYSLCQDGIWVTAPTSQRFIDTAPDKYLPDLNFTIPFTLQPPEPLEQGIVRCTFNGAEPDTTTPAFTENRLIETTTVVRCTEFVKNQARQKQTETYFINESINMPVVSISVAPEYVKEYLDAAPCKPDPCYEAKFWEDVEYPTHVEYFADGSFSKEKGFEIDAGISIAGNYSRNQQKKSVAIVMRKEYQDGRLHYSLFDTRPEKNKFKSFILRNNGNRFISDYFEDAVATGLLEGTNVDYQRSRQVVVFYNGQYRGIYDMREKLNEHFVETNYGISHNNVDFVKLNGYNIDVQNGTSQSYDDLMNIVMQNNFDHDDSAYNIISEMMETKNFMEYMGAEIYYRNEDWPDNNVRAWKSPSTPWRFIAFDTDCGFGWERHINGFTENENIINWAIHGGKKKSKCDTSKGNKCFNMIFAKLLQNSTFKQAFINRAAYLYSTYINSNRVSERVDSIYSTLDINQIARDKKIYSRQSYKNACGGGFDAKGDCLKSWSKKRDQSVRDDFREAFDLGKDISITIKVKGNGRLKLDDAYISQKDVYKWTVFKKHPMKLTIECYAGSKFKSWEDGSKNPNREITPKETATYMAECN